MEFEEMQVIWNSQNNEKLYAVNEEALFENIKRKGRSVNKYVKFVEVVMIFMNLTVGLWLLYEGLSDASWGQIVLAALYLIYSAYSVYRWFTRRQDEEQFEPTMLGELDKAIWRSNYLMRQGRDMVYYYLLPIVVVSILFLLLDGGDHLPTIAILILLVPATYYGGRWEIRKFHAPKKRDLEALRRTLLAADPD
ncbi:MAG: hypothetical protein AB8G95_20600 [Anaerolineae bacterium]